jgi:hypothetical protein
MCYEEEEWKGRRGRRGGERKMRKPGGERKEGKNIHRASDG